DRALGPVEATLDEAEDHALLLVSGLALHDLAPPHDLVVGEGALALAARGADRARVDPDPAVLDPHQPEAGRHGAHALALEHVERAVGLPPAAVQVADLGAEPVAEQALVEGGERRLVGADDRL